MNIYVAEVMDSLANGTVAECETSLGRPCSHPGEHEPTIATRYVLTAESADDAARIVGTAHNVANEDVRVGRLGKYEPGIEGAHMAPLSIIGTWTIDPA